MIKNSEGCLPNKMKYYKNKNVLSPMKKAHFT